MLTAFITCHYSKKRGHKVRNFKRKLERENDMEKSGKLNHEREKKCCSYHQTTGHSDKQCFQKMKKSENFKNGRQKKLCSLHNSTSHSNQECFEQKSDGKCKDSSTTVLDGKNSRKHENYVVGRTTVDCTSCCCSNGKLVKQSNERKVEYSPPPGIGFSFTCCHLPLSH